MRLVGGNISDTPVKEIGDGSAFAVGGSSDSAPALIEFGTIPATGTALSNFESFIMFIFKLTRMVLLQAKELK